MKKEPKLKIKAVAVLNENNPKFFEKLLKEGVDAVEPEMEKQIQRIKMWRIKKLYYFTLGFLTGICLFGFCFALIFWLLVTLYPPI